MNLVVELTGAIVERSGQRFVQDVDLTVACGSWFGLIGANGSGKTSLLRSLAGRLPSPADHAGSVTRKWSRIVPLARCVSVSLLLRTSCRMRCADATFSNLSARTSMMSALAWENCMKRWALLRC